MHADRPQARRHPHSAVLGVDIDKIKPPYQLPNCRFQVTDFTEKWSYDVKFDFIHLRHLGNLPSRDVVASIYEHLRPGGVSVFPPWGSRTARFGRKPRGKTEDGKLTNLIVGRVHRVDRLDTGYS